MSDEQTSMGSPGTPAGQPAAGQASSNASSSDPNVRRPIKIGSQRPDETTVVPSSSATKPPAAPPVSGKPAAPAERGERPEEEEDKTSDAAMEEFTRRGPVTAAEGWSAAAESALSAPRVPRVTADLQAEIDEALGDLSSLDALLQGESKPKPQEAKPVELDQRIPARVIKVDRESVFFSLGGPNQGITPVRLFPEPPEVGAVLEVIPAKYLVEDELYECMIPGGTVEVQDWSDVTEGVVVEAKVTGHNKGGLECEVKHLRAFMPASQVSMYRVEDFESFIGKTLAAVVTEANPQRRNLVLSHRAVLERERQESREKLLSELAVGQIREGIVRRLQPFGVFVDLGGIDGLIPIGQLSWERIRHPSDVVEEGQRIKVRVEKIDPATGKIGLSYRDLVYDPWRDVETSLPVGAVVDGTVSKIMEFGAFIRLAAGIEGLAHISELAQHRVQNVRSVVEEGQTVRVKILSIDPAQQRVSLSLKAALAAPTQETDEAEGAAESGSAAKASPAARRVSISNKPLQGGLSNRSEGDKFGLKW